MGTSEMDRLAVQWLGEVTYERGLELQQQAWQELREARGGERLLLLEHPAVITRGRSTQPQNLLVDEAELARRGVAVFDIARGGDVTYHAPGQLVGYLILDLAKRDRDLHAHLRRIELALMEACEDFDVPSKTIPGKTGIFVDGARHRTATANPGRERKLGSIGVGVRHWITQHGFGINVTTDLAGFESIVPCGLEDVDMTSLSVERGDVPAPGLPAAFRERVTRAFVARFG